jgi:hypothetical protein
MRGFTALFAASLALAGTRPALALCAAPGDPDCVTRRETFTGRLNFFATGASFTVNEDLDDRPDRVLDVAEVVVSESRIPSRATLSRAYLYFGGSLFFDDDFADDPDTTVEIQVPGGELAVVEGTMIHRSGPIGGFPEVILYTARADITELMRAAGGEMSGTYRVRNFDSDIFNGDAEHTVANASFSIVLIFEEPRLPPRTVVLFDGLQEVLGSTVTLDLSGFTVSQLPSGSLTLYAQEGDCNPGPDFCDNGNNLSGPERIRVIGADGQRTLIASDAVNPPNDIFNRTINTVEPAQRGVPGTDIDTFDISQVLMSGDDRVTVEITSPAPRGSSGELIGLVYVVVGIDVFAPELHIDSRIDIRTDRGDQLEEFFPGDPLRVAFIVSNTGNLPATEVSLSTDLPDTITRFEVAEAPENATVTITGKHVEIEGLAVRHGEINALTLLVETTCPLDLPTVLTVTASVGAPKEGGMAFTMTSSVGLLARDICGPRFFLFGGGGCSSVEPSTGFIVLILAVALFAFRRAKAWWLALLLLSCGEVENLEPDRAPPDPIGVACPERLEMVVVPSIREGPAFCIDRYEARIDGGMATSTRFSQPARSVTFEQASSACANAGKRLCTAVEWGAACGGEGDLTYPYGDEYETGACNGFDALRGDTVESGALLERCVSKDGVYDLSGNVWEWNSTAYLDGSRRGLVGGSFRSNENGLRCITEDNYALPDEVNDAFGFRCCKDAP